jgi:hypothetical protein
MLKTARKKVAKRIMSMSSCDWGIALSYNVIVLAKQQTKKSPVLF